MYGVGLITGHGYWSCLRCHTGVVAGIDGVDCQSLDIAPLQGGITLEVETIGLDIGTLLKFPEACCRSLLRVTPVHSQSRYRQNRF